VEQYNLTINIEYGCGSGPSQKLYYDTSAHCLDLFFNFKSNQALVGMFDLISRLFVGGFNEFFEGLGYENIAEMIYITRY
jgi:hypothetical protein